MVTHNSDRLALPSGERLTVTGLTAAEHNEQHPELFAQMVDLSNTHLRKRSALPPLTPEQFIAESKDNQYVVLATPDKVIGMISVHPTTEFYPGYQLFWVGDAVVRPGHRKQGYFSVLASELLNRIPTFWQTRFGTQNQPCIAGSAFNAFQITATRQLAEAHSYSPEHGNAHMINTEPINWMFVNGSNLFIMHGEPVYLERLSTGGTVLYTSSFGMITDLNRKRRALVRERHFVDELLYIQEHDSELQGVIPAQYVSAIKSLDFPQDLSITPQQSAQLRTLLQAAGHQIDEGPNYNTRAFTSMEEIHEVLKAIGIAQPEQWWRFNHYRHAVEKLP